MNEDELDHDGPTIYDLQLEVAASRELAKKAEAEAKALKQQLEDEQNQHAQQLEDERSKHAATEPRAGWQRWLGARDDEGRDDRTIVPRARCARRARCQLHVLLALLQLCMVRGRWLAAPNPALQELQSTRGWQFVLHQQGVKVWKRTGCDDHANFAVKATMTMPCTAQQLASILTTRDYDVIRRFNPTIADDRRPRATQRTRGRPAPARHPKNRASRGVGGGRGRARAGRRTISAASRESRSRPRRSSASSALGRHLQMGTRGPPSHRPIDWRSGFNVGSPGLTVPRCRLICE